MDLIWNPPLHEAYKILLSKTQNSNEENGFDELLAVEECEVPVIDVSRLEESDEVRREECKCEIFKACQEWGLFQVVKHGISNGILRGLRVEQEKIFKQPFEKKSKENTFFNFSSGSYRWGSPNATCIRQLSWSEAFHIPLTDILMPSAGSNTFSWRIQEFGSQVSILAQTLADILAHKMGHKCSFFEENCLASTCYIRLNRYPPCPFPSQVHGLMPHTDTAFLTILHQDQVRGLQMVKDGKWISVKPNPDALFIIIGDLFQAWSNGVYKSVEHRVVTNPKLERFSMAYFFCPSDDTLIESCTEPSLYNKFSFGEYRQQVRDDVHNFGYKIGLPNFLTRTGTTFDAPLQHSNV
ncbi:gibberellin 2-beta-dioxygenase 8 [Cajanus cajan]|uniref:Gibberellin 2-beta-dioxygenase 8 n=1 Tax=Cajanus cajan TaxID=3821 RepID=A0A151U6Y1_CAJCA|nr:gibberellin 2-beta-dioxygenase 8 [Cajanus cajan]KYP75086.1 Gibberellin 2-beta-dioxygenase 8 [Cajanus cajan]